MAERKSKVADGNEEPKATAKATETTAAAPLEAPQPKPRAEQPEPLSTAPNAVAPTAPYSDSETRLLSETGEPLSLEDFLEYPAEDAPRHEVEHPQIRVTDPKRLVTVTQRVFREYTHPNTTTKVTQLLYNKGARITKAEADRLSAEAMPPPNGAGMWTGGPVVQRDPATT